MRPKYIILLLFLIYISSTIAEDISIYSFIENIKQNPSAYTIVIGKNTPTEEIKTISGLASSLGITRSRFDTEITSNNNLVVVGTSGRNNLIKSMIGEFEYGKDRALIKISGNNLILIAENLADLRLAIDMLEKYEQNERSLSKQEYIAVQFLSPKNPTLWLSLLAALGLITLSTLAITKTKKHSNNQNIQTQPSALDQQLFQYIQSNLQAGYSKQQIRQALINSNWDQNLVDNSLNRFP